MMLIFPATFASYIGTLSGLFKISLSFHWIRKN